MPLRIKCRSCGRELLLEEVFSGTYCRCQHCRSLTQVPRIPQWDAKRPAVRPAKPPLASRQPSAGSAGASRAAREPAPHRTSFFNRLRSPAALATLMFVAASGIAATAWQVSSPSSTPPPDQSFLAALEVIPAGGEEVSIASDDPLLAMRTADPLKYYFGLPISGGTIGYVVDGDSAMAPYIDNLVFITNSVNEALEPGSCRFGVIMATGEHRGTLLEIHEPSTDLIGARTALTSRLPGGRTDLSKALSKTANWFADTIFLGLAKHVDEHELNMLVENAEQTGAITHVIAFGEAAKQDLSAISQATDGTFLRITDDMLNDLVARVQESQAQGR